MSNAESMRTVPLEVAKKNYRDLRDAKKSAEEAVEHLNLVRRDFLRNHGWDMQRDNPGSLWLYRKTTPDGATVLLDLQNALVYESNLQRFDFYDLMVHPDNEHESDCEDDD